MGECKTKAIQTNLGTFRHNQTYPGIIQAYSDIFRIMCYPDIFKAKVCPEPRHIQNQKHTLQTLQLYFSLKRRGSELFHVVSTWNTRGVFVVYLEPRHICNSRTFRTPLYSERWHIQNLRHIQNPVDIYDEVLIIFTAIIIFTSSSKHS